jgi:hypothetical protein
MVLIVAILDGVVRDLVHRLLMGSVSQAPRSCRPND